MDRRSKHLWVESDGGYLCFFVNRIPARPDSFGQQSWLYHRNPQTPGLVGPLGATGSNGTNVSLRSIFGFTFSAGKGGPRGIAVPHWFLALLLAIIPALYFGAAIRSRRRHRGGHCPQCGYDLRATPDRCPECGPEIISQKPEISGV